jgi:putative intracellular protease/amidase
MGAGASAGVVAALSASSEEDIKAALSKMSDSEKAKLLSALKAGEGSTAASKALKTLIVATSAKEMGDHKTGAWSEEICGPFFVFKDAGCDVSVCSINGGAVPIDQGSLSDQFETDNDRKMMNEYDCVPLQSTKKLADIEELETYDIVFFAGGHGTCVDFPTDAVGEVVSKVLAAGKVLAAVCHGPMCLVKAKTESGDPVVKGKKMACFTDVEEGQVGLTDKVPFLLEAKMKELGATVETADPWNDKAVADGKLVTGQNPQSSVSCAKLAIATAK